MKHLKWAKCLLSFVILTGALMQVFLPIAYAEEQNAKKPMVALTFDDGPHPGHTDMVLDVLKEQGVKATFFVIGKNVECYTKPMIRAAAEGHQIENHSYDHQTKGKSYESLRESIERTSDLIEKHIGKRPGFFRPPQGWVTESVKTAVSDLSLRQVFWTIDAEDWTGKCASSIIKQVLDNAKGNEIVLFHDYQCPNHQLMQALPKVIEGLRQKGYRFVTIEEYFAENTCVKPFPLFLSINGKIN